MINTKIIHALITQSTHGYIWEEHKNSRYGTQVEIHL